MLVLKGIIIGLMFIASTQIQDLVYKAKGYWWCVLAGLPFYMVTYYFFYHWFTLK